jgi:hypothetical protein
MGFAPTTLCPNHEAYAIEWRNKITKAFIELTAEYESMAKSVIEADELIRKLRADKKELTVENERLKLRVLEENHLRHQAEEMLANGMDTVKADTVGKMHSMLCEGRVSNDNVVIVANQVAKEILKKETPHNTNTCISCGESIPEGRQVCSKCEESYNGGKIS